MSLRTTFSVLALAASSLLGACTTMVEFTSTPTGATVKYLDREIGTTPFTYGLSDQVGWFNSYVFNASLDGYDAQTLVFTERTPLDGQLVVPPKVHFELKAKTSSAAAPAVVAAAPYRLQ